MANTITVATALEIVGLKYPRLITDGFGPRFASEVQAEMWKRYPWRGTLADMTPFYLLMWQADYGAPLVVIPSDFYGIHDAWLREATGYQVHRLTVKDRSRVSFGPGTPTTISYIPEKLAFRLHPRPAMTCPNWWVEGVYKKSAPLITSANVNNYVLPWDDMYFPVFRKGLEAKYKDEILGSQDAQAELQYFYYLLDKMAADEGLHSGVVMDAPAEDSTMEYGG